MKRLSALAVCWTVAAAIAAQVPRPSERINTNRLDDARVVGLASAVELTATPTITLPPGFPPDIVAVAIALEPGAAPPFSTLTDVVKT